jgi:SAM-dependent methyltransferase
MIPYPYEAFWLERIGANSPEDLCLQALEKPIQTLSDHFTLERPKAFSNYTEAESLLAYGLFFFPQTFTRLQFVIKELLDTCGWSPAKPPAEPIRLLDAGAGLGAGGLSILWSLHKHFANPLHGVAYDHSPSALNFLRTHSQSLLPQGATLECQQNDLKHLPKTLKQAAPLDIILFSFSLNECFSKEPPEALERYLTQLLQSLSPKGILLCVEPALKNWTPMLQGVAESIVAKHKAHLLAPGFGTAYPGNDLPHEVRRWDPPQSMQFLNRKLFRAIETLKFHFIALIPNALEKNWVRGPQLCRLISPMTQAKGCFLWQGWASDGKKYAYDIQTRHWSKSEIEIFSKIERGAILKIEALQAQKTPNHFRVESPNAIEVL